MSDDFNKLKVIGIQKIYEKTHIARHHVKAILDENFQKIKKVQFFGFISILERDYDVDLSDIKEKSEEFYASEELVKEEKPKVFILQKKKKKFKFLYIILLLCMVLIVSFLTLDLSSISSSKKDVILKVKPPVKPSPKINKNEIKTDTNISTSLPVKEEVKLKPTPKDVVKSLKIIAKRKVWMGYIDLSTFKKFQKTFSGELELDPTKEWLLTLGHGYIDVEIDAKLVEFKVKQNIRLLYKDFNITKINYEEFKKLNRGQKW